MTIITVTIIANNFTIICSPCSDPYRGYLFFYTTFDDLHFPPLLLLHLNSAQDFVLSFRYFSFETLLISSSATSHFFLLIIYYYTCQRNKKVNSNIAKIKANLVKINIDKYLTQAYNLIVESSMTIFRHLILRLGNKIAMYKKRRENFYEFK